MKGAWHNLVYKMGHIDICFSMPYDSKAHTMVFLLPIWALTIGLLLSPCQCQYQMTCQTAVGDFRDCTCGVRYRDLEQRCCSGSTCLKPVALSENFTCPFICENGGTYNAERSYCLCPEGYGGLCCEKGDYINKREA